ncbi:type II toxin-antitoxin system VapC family toxin [Pararhodobacter marinus]|uniref:type II toxin-antitoxin system VapC family toxin n=1 Tax=Pararhodobacter marinus TaxID=2184063 RepID=UPI003515BF9E
MIVVFDTSVLIFLFEKEANGPQDPETGEPLPLCYERVNHLVKELQDTKAKVIIPAPVLAELLLKAGDATQEWLQIIDKTSHITVAPFDMIAALEHSVRMRERGKLAGRDKRNAKFDEQIIAIAAVNRAEVIYSSDGDIKRGAGEGIRVVDLHDMDLPPEAKQGFLFPD